MKCAKETKSLHDETLFRKVYYARGLILGLISKANSNKLFCILGGSCRVMEECFVVEIVSLNFYSCLLRGRLFTIFIQTKALISL